ncbi:MmcQ/YjbR family DNA-binding protein [Pontibacter ruber]|uniref:MmcQ/YjbR family DNA-binding protein n=1 Tax=Pontibacter ruber TaxID=1343895 RepID=A0ABW5D0U1_9BACT|nr:MmcQ/YjbR family DNA-binding protein [Pontibacter ruber]
MTIEDIQTICLELKGVTEDIKWEDHLCFNIGGKMFLVTSPDNVPVSVSFKVPDEEFEELIATDIFTPAQYLARYKWVYVDDIRKVSKAEWERFARQSYALVAAKLPAKLRRELAL